MARRLAPAAALLVLVAASVHAADKQAPTVAIRRAAGPIAVDGDLSDAGWKDAAVVDTWYETNPGDNVPASVKNVARLTYDDKFFYASFDLQDPDPSRIRAPLGDRDNVPGDTDYAGVILDTRNDGKTGLLFLSNARAIQYDAITDDTSGNEDSSPDFFWDSVARITATGWVLEMRIPFSSLRYPKADPATWGIILYRNWPRAFRTQMMSAKMPRGGNCFICHSNEMTGLAGLPAGGHLVIAPYLNARQTSERPEDGPLGLESHDPEGDLGGDVKWTPTAGLAIDATLNPDFSQIESDVAQIGANERFALSFPEKRPFFLEGVELFSTPMQAVYTRTITSPRWGLRGTGKSGPLSYTGLFSEDRGGGQVVLPGANSSDVADQDFRSYVAVGRVRRDLGRSFVSVLATDRQVKGGGYNRVIGPDFQWRPTASDTMTGQLLFSQSRTPQRPDLADEWNGQKLAGRAFDAWFQHTKPKYDAFVEHKEFDHEFRADDGFIPQVGFHETYTEVGRTFRPTKGFLRRLRTFSYYDRSVENGGALLNRDFSVGAGMDGKWSSFIRLWYQFGRVRADQATLNRQRLQYILQFTPARWLSQVVIQGFVGQQVDFDNSRTGRGGTVQFSAAIHPTNHLELRLNEERRLLSVQRPDQPSVRARLFTAHLDRVRATYTFTSRMFLRAIGQYVQTTRDPRLYLDEVDRKSASFSGSALFAYKLNWQTVVFLGYGDDREFDLETERLQKQDRQVFLKISYAFQR